MYESGKRDTRSRLLSSAAAVFSELGYNRATVREIVYRAGTNVAAVNYHFGDKAALYEEVLRRQPNGVAVGIGPPDMPPDLPTDGTVGPRQALKSFLAQAALQGLRSDYELPGDKFLAWEILSPTGQYPAIVAERLATVLDPLERLIQAVIARPLPEAEARALAVWIHGQAVQFAAAAPLVLANEAKRLTETEIQAIADRLAEIAVIGLCQYADEPKRAAYG